MRGMGYCTRLLHIFAYNTSKHASSLYSPFEIMYGRNAVLPVEFSADEDNVVPEELQDAQVNICMYIT